MLKYVILIIHVGASLRHSYYEGTKWSKFLLAVIYTGSPDESETALKSWKKTGKKIMVISGPY